MYAHYSDGNRPTTGSTGTLSLSSTNPENCQAPIIGTTCAQQYWFSVQSGFIQLISTSTDSCIAGSAQQSTAYFTKGRQEGRLSNISLLMAILTCKLYEKRSATNVCRVKMTCKLQGTWVKHRSLLFHCHSMKVSFHLVPPKFCFCRYSSRRSLCWRQFQHDSIYAHQLKGHG